MVNRPRGLMAKALDFGPPLTIFSRDSRFDSWRGRNTLEVNFFLLNVGVVCLLFLLLDLHRQMPMMSRVCSSFLCLRATSIAAWPHSQPTRRAA